MTSFLKLNLGSLILMGIFMIFSTIGSADCIINDQLLYDLKKKRSTSCKDWPYENPSLSRASCQECIERLADVCWFIKDTPMSLDQKEELDQRCEDLQQE